MKEIIYDSKYSDVKIFKEKEKKEKKNWKRRLLWHLLSIHSGYTINGLMVDQCSLALIQELKHKSKRKSAF